MAKISAPDVSANTTPPPQIVIGTDRVNAGELQQQLDKEILQLELQLRKLTTQPQADPEKITHFETLLEERRTLRDWAGQQSGSLGKG